MEYFTTNEGVLFYCYSIDLKRKAKLDAFRALLEKSSVKKYLMAAERKPQNGRPAYDALALFATIVYGFSMGCSSVRDLEDSCRENLSFIYLMNGEEPSYPVFSRFINECIKPHSDEIFACIVSAIFEECGLGMDDCFIDGTKIEADANKYKFVWRPDKLHERLCSKVRALLDGLGLSRGIPSEGIFSSSLIADKLSEAKLRYDAEDAVVNAKIESLSSYLGKALEYEEKERICGPGRKSYYKTDHDATAMCMKADYYSGAGSCMHAAYQIQNTVSHGLITSFYISQDRTDIYTMIPSLEKFRAMYGFYPRRLCADAGYGCHLNYSYCRDKGIMAFIKYQAWEGECSGKRPALYEMNDDLSITCLGGRNGFLSDVPGRHHRAKDSRFYKVEGCCGCMFMAYCRMHMREADGDSRIFEISPEFQILKQQARDLLLSPEGIEMRVNRSCQTEGSFGGIKYNMDYVRFRRTGLMQVSTEYMLTALGYDLRKYFRFIDGRARFRYWKAPSDLKSQKFKKPSAKRIAKRALKTRSQLGY